MSRIGGRQLEIPSGIDFLIGDLTIEISKDSNKISIKYDRFLVEVTRQDNGVVTVNKNTSKESRAQCGTINSLIANSFVGFTTGFVKVLDIRGVGYSASMKDGQLKMDLGFSHPVFLDIPEEVTIEIVSSVEIKLSSFNKEVLGHFAAIVRKLKPPEPYKGKGVRYKDEVVTIKPGKMSDGKK